MKVLDQTIDIKTGATVFKIKTRAGILTAGAVGLTKAGALMAIRDEIKEDKEDMTILEKIAFKSSKDLAQAIDIALVKAYDLSPLVVKMPPKLFALYAKIKGLNIKHTNEAVEFYRHGKKVAEQKIIKGFIKGKFVKYER